MLSTCKSKLRPGQADFQHPVPCPSWIPERRAQLIEKHEFQPRIRRLRERLGELEQQAHEIADEVALRAEMRLVITRLEEFAVRVKDGLAEADWSLQRELIRTLVGRVEVGKEAVNVVFRIPPETVPLSGEKKKFATL